MDAKDFIKRQTAFDGFVKCRKEILSQTDRGNFVEAFTELCTKALEGDCIAQDCVAYFFHKGVPDELSPYYELYMSWQILAGANGNEFDIKNGFMSLSNLLCEALVDELQIDAKELINRPNSTSLYSPEKLRVFSVALENSLPRVVDYMQS